MRRRNHIVIVIACLMAILCFSHPAAVELIDLVSKEDIQKIKKIKTLRSSGTIEMGSLKGKIEISYAAPDKVYLSSDFGMFKLSQGFDGKTAWLKDQNDLVMELVGSEKKSLVNAAYLAGMSYLLDDRMTGKIEYLKDTVIDGSEYVIFSALPTIGDSLTLFYSMKNRRVEITGENLDEIRIFSYMSDFRLINGFELPFVYESRSNVPEFNSTIKLSEIEFNIPFDPAIFSMSPEEAEDFYFPGNVDSIVIPFLYYNGHIFIEATINGQRKVYFILDSGAGANVLDSSYAVELGLSWTGELPARGIAGYQRVAFARIDSLSVGKIKLGNHLVGVVDLKGMSLRLPGELGGLIGYDLLSRLPFKVNYVARELIFYNPDRFIPPDSEFAVDFEPIMKVPSVIAEYGGLKARFLIDLGNPFSLMLHKSFVDRHNLKKTFSDIKEMKGRIGGVGGKSDAYAAAGPDLRIGPVEIKNPPLMVAEADKGIVESSTINGNIGNLLLQRFSIVMDYGGKKIYILPADN